MFLIIPLILALSCVAGIAVIIWRKLPYLRKLSPELNQTNGSVLYNFFPEVMDGVKNFDFGKYQEAWLNEVEKILRRLRLVTLRMDYISGKLIKKVRSISEPQPNESMPVAVQENSVSDLGTVQIKVKPVERTLDDMKREEQRMIMEIAKNPKDGGIYLSLGNLYFEMGNYSDAKESYEAAMELLPENEDVKIRHSKVLEKIKLSEIAAVK